MSRKTRIVGFIIGLVTIVWTVYGHNLLSNVEPSVALATWELILYPFIGALCMVGALWPWRCVKCHGDGVLLDLGMNDQIQMVPVEVPCDWCGGTGKGNRD